MLLVGGPSLLVHGVPRPNHVTRVSSAAAKFQLLIVSGPLSLGSPATTTPSLVSTKSAGAGRSASADAVYDELERVPDAGGQEGKPGLNIHIALSGRVVVPSAPLPCVKV